MCKYLLILFLASWTPLETKGWQQQGTNHVVRRLPSVSLKLSSQPPQECEPPANSKEENFKRLEKLINWRGEKEHGNSMQLRHKEFTSALASVLEEDSEDDAVDPEIVFTSALSSDFERASDMSEYEKYAYENAMQYIDSCSSDVKAGNEHLMKAVRRSALVRSLFEIVAEGDNYPELAQTALDSNNLNDMMTNGSHSTDTWRVSMRQYGGEAKIEKQKQYGKKMRSPMQEELRAINQMEKLFIEFTGPVDLKDPDISLYLFEGLEGRKKILARLLTRGANTSAIAPKTRICVTNTPLCPLAAFTMCNVARVKPGYRIFDPFCGSCAILLAASMIEPSVKTVGVEIAHNGQVNRDNIVKDFTSRNLTLPAAIIRGDSMSEDVRKAARIAVGDEPFDAIITDPPYGIRETSEFCVDPPLINLVRCIAKDRARGDGQRLLRLGGRLVAFVPNQEGDDIAADMPSIEDLAYAGLEFVKMFEQPLNDSLSRWLVEYKCINVATTPAEYRAHESKSSEQQGTVDNVNEQGLIIIDPENMTPAELKRGRKLQRRIEGKLQKELTGIDSSAQEESKNHVRAEVPIVIDPDNMTPTELKRARKLQRRAERRTQKKSIAGIDAC